MRSAMLALCALFALCLWSCSELSIDTTQQLLCTEEDQQQGTCGYPGATQETIQWAQSEYPTLETVYEISCHTSYRYGGERHTACHTHVYVPFVGTLLVQCDFYWHQESNEGCPNDVCPVLDNHTCSVS